MDAKKLRGLIVSVIGKAGNLGYTSKVVADVIFDNQPSHTFPSREACQAAVDAELESMTKAGQIVKDVTVLWKRKGG